MEAIESGGDTASASDDLGDDGKALSNQLYSIVPWPYKDNQAATIHEEVSEPVTASVILIRLQYIKLNACLIHLHYVICLC